MAANPSGRRSEQLKRISDSENQSPMEDTGQKRILNAEDNRTYSIRRSRPALEEKIVSGSKVIFSGKNLEGKGDPKLAAEVKVEPWKEDCCNYKLYDVEIPSTRKKFDANPTSITNLLVDAIKMELKAPEKLPDPVKECGAIVNGLIRYVSWVSPSEFIQLYQVNSTRKRVCTDPEKDEDYVPGKRKSRKVFKSWGYVAELGGSEELKQLLASPEVKKAFEKKMTDIMAASLEVDPYKWPMCEVGYTLAFWITGLYEKSRKARNKSTLPNQLLTGREHFQELHDLCDGEWDVCTE